MKPLYALFDPASEYNKLRSALIPQEKIRGYFYWRQTRRARGEEQGGPPSRTPLVFRGGAPPVRIEARVKIPMSDPLPGCYAIEVQLDAAGLPEVDVPCRAFLVEQGVLDRLRSRGLPAVVCREGYRVTLRDLATWQVRAKATVKGGLRTAAVLSEERVAVLTLDGTLQVWNTVDGTLTTVVDSFCEKSPWGLIAAGDAQIAWGTAAGEVIALDFASGKKRLVHQHDSPVTCLARLSEGQLASGHADGVVCVGDEKLAGVNGEAVGAIAAISDGGLAFATSTGHVRIWKPGSTALASLPTLATGLAGLPDGHLATAGPPGLTLWDFETPPQPRFRMLSDAPARHVLAAPGPCLIQTADDDSLWAWNLRTGTDRPVDSQLECADFVQPLASGSLRPSLDGADVKALAQLLDHRLLSEEFHIQQAVSALPELEGQSRRGRIVLETEIPAGSPNIADRAWVVVVLGEAESG